MVEGAVVKMPMRLLVASMERVLVSKERPLTPPERVRLVSLAKVQASLLTVTTSPEASPNMVAPLIRISPPVLMEPVAWTPLVTSRPPAKELEAVPSTNNWPSISRSPEIKRSLVVVIAALPAVAVPKRL